MNSVHSEAAAAEKARRKKDKREKRKKRKDAKEDDCGAATAEEEAPKEKKQKQRKDEDEREGEEKKKPKPTLAGQIARAATVFRIDEVVVFDSTPAAENGGAGDGEESGARFLVRILEYLETPQYLRRRLFPMHKNLKFVGLLPPLDAPHHVRKHEWSEFREGVTLESDPSKGTLVDVGLSKNVLVEQTLEPGKRVTVAMGTNRDLTTACIRKVVPPSTPREQMGSYWGYKVRYTSNLSSVFKNSPFKEEYDHIIGTSEHGQIVNSSELTLPTFRHLLIAFGGLAGLEESIEEDTNLKGKRADDVFTSYLNTCPNQGSRTIRTEVPASCAEEEARRGDGGAPRHPQEGRARGAQEYRQGPRGTSPRQGRAFLGRRSPIRGHGRDLSLVTRLSSLSSNMPTRILEFLNKECTGHTNEKAEEIEIDLGSMTRSAMFELQKLLDEFAEEEKRRQQKEESMNVCRSISRSSSRELEEGEFIEEDCSATTDCGDASPVVACKGLSSPPRILEDGKMTEEEDAICGDTGPVATAETAKSPSNSSSSGSSSSSDGSSGSSCDSSNSDHSDLDSDNECMTSNVAPAVLPIPKADASAIAMPTKGLCSPPRNDDRGGGDSDSSDSGSDDECVTINPAPEVLPKTDASPMAMPHKVLSPIAEEEFAETRNCRRSNSSLLEDGEIEEEHGTSPVAAEKFAETVNSTGSANGQCVRSSLPRTVRPEPSKPQPAAQGTVRRFYAKGFEKKRERAVAAQGTVGHFYAKAFEKKRERQRAYEKLEEMERNAKAKPIFDWIHPGHLRQLGITTPVEYAVTSERRFPARHGCPVQSLLGLFLKA
ncbi:unnamed protein product [Miscanthus lutarioriparius]|uniref:NET domain-containing protein n=1 Tax=Miscanthus lutarioriparius TaxID=422564 RepID=A0A811SEZ3_9POAL|nr:unnamed protein product [Miscanthus lutarioriparius]